MERKTIDFETDGSYPHQVDFKCHELRQGLQCIVFQQEKEMSVYIHLSIIQMTFFLKQLEGIWQLQCGS